MDETTENLEAPVEAKDVNLHLVCPNCDAPMVDRGCKLKCTRCGYFMSCADYI